MLSQVYFYNMSKNTARKKRIDLIKQKAESVEIAVTEGVHPALPMSTVDEKSLNWLKIAERSFRFWNNKIDDIWSNV